MMGRFLLLKKEKEEHTKPTNSTTATRTLYASHTFENNTP
jgi:hypothetical protein